MWKILEHLPWLRAFQNILDILLVACLVYSLLHLIRGTRTMHMLIGLVFSILVYLFSSVAELYTLNWILYHFLESLLLILVILFQNEIRRFLMRIGQTSFIPFLGSTQDTKMVDEIVRASFSLANKKIGALIVIEKDEGLNDYIETGVSVDATISKELLTTIFLPSSPLHDGAVMIQKGRISHASCFLPLSMSADLDNELGTRHRAAIGLTEEVDAIAVCVSEERGWVSVVSRGKITRGVDGIVLRKMLNDHLSANSERFVGLAEEKSDSL